MASCIHDEITTTTTTTGVVGIGFSLSNSVPAYGTPAVFRFDQEPDGDMVFIPYVPPRCRMMWSLRMRPDSDTGTSEECHTLRTAMIGHWTCVLVTIVMSPQVSGGIRNLLVAIAVFITPMSRRGVSVC